MNAILQARAVYTRFGSLRSFEQDLCAHLQWGVVLSTPRAFAMGRPVRHDAAEPLLADISHVFPDADCWLIWSAAGNLQTLVRMLPEPLPWIAFHRTSERRQGPQPLRVYKTDRLLALANRTGMRERDD